MKNTTYVICTDSASDMPPEMLSELGITATPLTFRFDGETQDHADGSMRSEEFYTKMKEGSIAKTSAANTESFVLDFKKHLDLGYDVLYLGFSSALSTTYNSARIAAETLAAEYPDRKILTVDMLCASAGGALLIDAVLEKKNQGATIDEAAEYAEKIKLNICHWFTVDDLVYLKRGGRVSPTVAFVGNVLGIKPVMHVDNEGRLVKVGKVRGRKNSITELADKYGELRLDKESKVYISHGNCLEDAQLLAKTIEEKYGKRIDLITNVGPVIGAHSGPGTLALFFLGKER